MNGRPDPLVLLAVLFACVLAANVAFGEAGKVVFAVGDVAALRGASRIPLSAGSTIDAGDTIVTAAQSHVQLRFSDDALVALKPDSEFRIERYNFAGQQDGTEIAVFRLVSDFVINGSMIDGDADDGMRRNVFHALPAEIHHASITQTRFILLDRPQAH